MNYLLTQNDELELIHFLREKLGAQMLLSDIAPGGDARIASSTFDALPNLPKPAKYGCKDIYQYKFWLKSCGPIITLGSAPQSTHPKDRVVQFLTKEAAGDSYEHVIDFMRTPSLSLTRTTQMNSRRLAPGVFGAMPVGTKDMPSEVIERYTIAQHWLKKRGTKIDPFAHCPEVEHLRPNRLGVLWVSVQPDAMTLVESGMEIWPWNA